MDNTAQPSLSRISARLDRIREQIGRSIEAAAENSPDGLSRIELEEREILRSIPDLIFRIRRKGVVSVPGNSSLRFVAGSVPDARKTPAEPAGTSEGGQPSAQDEPWDPVRSIGEELAHRSKGLLAKAIKTSSVQVVELQFTHHGRTRYYDVRAVSFNHGEVLAVVRNVTTHREADNALAKSKEELEIRVQEQAAEIAQLKEVYQREVSLRTEEEETRKKSLARVEKLLEDTIGAIALIVQKKDPYTAGHQQRVSQLACAMGAQMGLKNDQIRVIRIAALLHDLGKAFIPAEILAKPGKLSQAEVSMVKAHPDADYEILKTIDFSCSIADIVHQHHERIDGSGYPKGLKGDDILLESRILAVADVVEAMISNRPYRPAKGIDAAIKEITSGRGTLYDPDAVEACIRLFREGGFSFERREATSSSKSS